MVAYLLCWLFVFAIPWENAIVLPGLGTIGKLVGIVAFGVTAVRVLLTAKVRRLASFHWVVFAFLCWVLLSISWAVNTICSPIFGCPVQNTITTYLQIFAMLWVLWEATPTRPRVLNLFQAYVLGAYVAAANTIYNYAIGAALKHAYGRYAAEGFDPNDLGMLLALALPMAWYLGSSTPGAIQRWVNRGYFVIGSVAILLTGSRGALLAMIVALSVVPWTMTQVRRGVRIAAVVCMLGAGLLSVRFVPTTLFHRLSTTTSEISRGTMNQRIVIWREGLAVVTQRPLQWYGPAGWQIALRHTLADKGPHNTFLSITLNQGLIGLFIFLTACVLLLRHLLGLPSTFERRVGLTILATLTIANLPLTWDTRKSLWLMLALLMAWSEVFAPVPGTLPLEAAMGVRHVPAARRVIRGVRRAV